MQWEKAAATADEIAADWSKDPGPGGCLILFDRDGVRVASCGGLANLDHALPFRVDTAVRYASVSKHFLATILLTGTPVALEDRLGDHLILQDALAGATVGRAVDMTGGLPDLMETLWLQGVPPSTALSRHRLMDAAQRITALNFQAGTEISYSNTGYRLVQAALAAKGLDYGVLLQERICRGLDLGIRLVEDQTEPVPRMATGYWRGAQGWRAGRYGLHYSASGGLVGSGHDLADWGRALLTDRGPVPDLLDRLSAPRHLADGRVTGYGLGLARSAVGGRTLFGHGGSLPGFRTHLLLDPATGTGAVVLANRDDVDAAGLALRLMAALHGAELPAPAAPLPAGLFATASGPFWLLSEGNRVTFMGATETLYEGEGAWAAGRSAHLPMRLRAEGGDIVGEIGHVARRFHLVAERQSAQPGWAGRYHGAEVIVGGRIAQLRLPGAGAKLDLRAIDAGRALAVLQEGASSQQICVMFHEDGLRLFTNRSRVVRFRRG